MNEYDALIESCRACALRSNTNCDRCMFCRKDNLEKYCHERLHEAAADAIEELQKDLERSKDFEAFWQYEAEEALKKFQVAISNKPCWIPVTERLPEDRNMVLATVDGVVRIAFYGNYMWEEIETYSIFYPTHWMPIPQPPKDGES